MKLVKAGETQAELRRVEFDIRDNVTGLTPVTNLAGGQPWISVNGATFVNTGIGKLVHTGFGRYYADINADLLKNPGTVIQTRFKGGSTVETPGTTLFVVSFDPDTDIATIRDNVAATSNKVDEVKTISDTLVQKVDALTELASDNAGADQITAITVNLVNIEAKIESLEDSLDTRLMKLNRIADRFDAVAAAFSAFIKVP